MNFSFTTLSIHNNPWICSCDQVWFKAWLISIYDQLENPNSIQCFSPDWLKGKAILSVSDIDFCRHPNTVILGMTVPSVAITMSILFIIATISLYKFRIKIYTNFKFHPFDRDECFGENLTYDIFIAFSHDDRSQSREILEFLETNSYKVCYHEKDFMPGVYIMDNIAGRRNTR